MGVDPQALVQSQKDGLVITENNGNVTKLKGNPLVLLKNISALLKYIQMKHRMNLMVDLLEVWDMIL